jgi:WD40 repeat protein
LSSSHVLLGPLAADDLLRAVHEPAQRCGLVIEEGLGEVIAAELGDAPGTLPLLGHALREAWLRRESRTITLAGYRASGGVRSAIATTADRALAALDAEDRQVARRVLLRMVELRPDGDDARRWASTREVTEIAPGRAPEVVSVLTASRLLVVDRDQVTVVHEALLRAWPQLNEWITDARSDLLARQEVRWAAERWAAGGRNDSDLYRGARVDAATELAARESLPAQDAAFVDASRQLRDREVADQRRRSRRLRVLAAVASVLALVALVVGAIAVIQRNDAQEARTDADAAAREAQIEALVGRAESIRATQRDVSALLAVEAFRLSDTPRTRSALLSTFTESEGFLDAHRFDGEGGSNGIVLPDGERAFLLDLDGRPRPYDLATGSLGDPFPALGPGDRWSVLATTADGALIAQGARDNFVAPADVTTTVGIFDSTTGVPRFEPVFVDAAVTTIAFTPDNSTLVMTVEQLDGPSELRFIDAATGAPVSTGNEIAVDHPAFLSGLAGVGDEIVVGSSDGTISVLDAETLALQRSFSLPTDTAWYLLAVGDGTMITSGPAGHARVDVATGTIRWQQPGETCLNMTVIADRGRLYCGDLFGRLAEQDLATGLTLRRLDVQNGNSGPLWPADGGAELVSFSDNEPVVSRWRLDGSGPITHLVAPGWSALGFSADGAHLLVDRGDTPETYAAQVVDSVTGETDVDLSGMQGPVWLDDDTVGGAVFTDATTAELAHHDLGGAGIVTDGFVFDPVPDEVHTEPGKERALFRYGSGSDIAVESSDIISWDPETREYGPRITVERLVTMAITRGGDRIAAGTGTGVFVFDGITGQQVGELRDTVLRGVYITLADQLFTSSLGGELTQYDLDTLTPIRTFGGSRGYVQNVFGTVDGTMIAAKGGDRSVTLFDVASGVRLGTPITLADDVVNAIALDPAGTRLAVNGVDGVQIWDLDPDRWVEAACELAGRNLTREEWATNVGELAPYGATCERFPIGD